MRSVEAKALGSDEGAEIGALRHRILPRLVLRPAVEGGRAKARRVALLAIGPQRRAPAVIGVDLLGEIAFLETLLMQRDG